MSIRLALKAIVSKKELFHLKRMKTILVSFVDWNAFTDRKFITVVMNVISITATSVSIGVDTLY